MGESKRNLTTLVAVLAVALPASAAASPVHTQYGNPVANQAQPPPRAHLGEAGAPPAGGTLPFTGADVALFAALGGTLAASGLVLRGVARRRRD